MRKENRMSRYNTEEKLIRAREVRRTYYAKTKPAKNHNKKWHENEVIEVLIRNGTDEEIAFRIGRSTQAVQSMRHKIKKDFNQLYSMFDDNTVEVIKIFMK